jgi:predicted RNA-binding Zn-ribbon protein involved in translation (DUF1610 family)
MSELCKDCGFEISGTFHYLQCIAQNPEKRLIAETVEKCSMCGGDGLWKITGENPGVNGPCPNCNGSGNIPREPVKTAEGPYVFGRREGNLLWVEGPGVAHTKVDELSAGADVARLNIAFAQGQAQSAKEVAELRKTLANIPINGEDEARIFKLEAEVSRLRGALEEWVPGIIAELEQAKEIAQSDSFGHLGVALGFTKKLSEALNPPSEREGV